MRLPTLLVGGGGRKASLSTNAWYSLVVTPPSKRSRTRCRSSAADAASAKRKQRNRIRRAFRAGFIWQGNINAIRPSIHSAHTGQIGSKAEFSRHHPALRDYDVAGKAKG